MQQIEQGDVLTLSNNREYLAFATATSKQDAQYIYLMTMSEPVDIRFAEQRIVDGQPDLRFLSEPDEKRSALDVLKISQARQKVADVLNSNT